MDQDQHTQSERNLPSARLGRRWRHVADLVLISLAIVPQAALADAPMCPIDPPLLDAAAHLRAASLDLRGTTPDLTEIATLPADAQVTPEAWLDNWLASPAWSTQVVRHHRDLLWNNLANSAGRLMPPSSNLAAEGGLYYRTLLAPAVRGQKVPCLDEPAMFSPSGDIVYKPQADGTTREGWVMVQPYWNPAIAIKVCAYDAQDNDISPAGTYCGASGATQDMACGCGPNLRYCMGGGAANDIANGLAESLDRQIQAWAVEGRPYTDLLTEHVLWVNGPVVHHLKYQAQTPGQVRLVPYAVDVNQLPNLAFTDKDKWQMLSIGSFHAGILTHPGYLLRFQTQRARANRFFNVFLCQPFQAPEGGIPVAGVGAIFEPDLQKRPGCKYCHVLLEPASKHWGRWTPNGGGYMNPLEFPAQRDDCLTCAKTGAGCSADCKAFYLTKAYAPPEQEWLGWLVAYNYTAPQHIKNIENGPELLVKTSMADNRLPRCVAKSTAEWLLGRQLVPDEAIWADQLAIALATNKFDYRKLVKAIVLSDAYRRAP